MEAADIATDVLIASMVLSSILAMPSHLLYNGILAIQIVSHIPLNNINLPRVSLGFMHYVNQVVSFKKRALFEKFPIDDLKMMLAVRTDLGMTKGKLCA